MIDEHFDGSGNLHVGAFSRLSKSRITVDFSQGDADGIAMDIAPAVEAVSERAAIQFGDYVLGQDTAKSGDKNFGLLDGNGDLVATLSGLDDGVVLLDFQSTIPLIIAPTGSIANNGVLTSGTVNPLIYLKTYTFFPEGAIVALSAAGWYYTVWTTTTAAVIYNNVWDGASEPTVPASPTAFVTTGPGAFTGPTAEAAYVTIPLAAASVNAFYEIDVDYHMTNNANAKTAKVRMNTVAGTVLASDTLTSLLHAQSSTFVQNNGVANKQRVSHELVSAAAIARASPALAAETLSAAFAFAVTFTKATATDVAVIEAIRVTRSR